MLKSIEVSQFEKEARNDDLIIDVRNISEYEKSHLVDSHFLPFGIISEIILASIMQIINIMFIVKEDIGQ